MQPGGLPDLGTLYKGGLVNGMLVWTQPDGPGTLVSPPLPTQYPIEYQGFPQTVMSYEGLFVFGCGHWCNNCEVFEQYDIYADVSAAICCCPVCSFVVLIVEPYNEWENNFYSIYPQGLGSATFPSL